jgi:hypothetical protein
MVTSTSVRALWGVVFLGGERWGGLSVSSIFGHCLDLPSCLGCGESAGAQAWRTLTRSSLWLFVDVFRCAQRLCLKTVNRRAACGKLCFRMQSSRWRCTR